MKNLYLRNESDEGTFTYTINRYRSYMQQDAREAMRVVFSVLTKRICMHKTKFIMNIFKYCFKNYIKLHELAHCNSANYDV